MAFVLGLCAVAMVAIATTGCIALHHRMLGDRTDKLRAIVSSAVSIAAGLDAMRAALSADGVELTLHRGAEIASTRAVNLEDCELDRLTLGSGRWLLIEPPFAPSAVALPQVIARLRGRGYEVIIAHPERCACFQSDPAMLADLVESGCLASVTAGSLVGRFGGSVKRFAEEMMSNELVHNVASDAHDARRRPPGIADELERVGWGAIVPWATIEVPAAILAGDAIPPRPPIPSPARRGRWAWSRRAAKPA